MVQDSLDDDSPGSGSAATRAQPKTARFFASMFLLAVHRGDEAEHRDSDHGQHHRHVDHDVLSPRGFCWGACFNTSLIRFPFVRRRPPPAHF